MAEAYETEWQWFRRATRDSLWRPRAVASSLAREHYGLAGVLVALLAGCALSVSVDWLVLASKGLSPLSFATRILLDAALLGLRLAIVAAVVSAAVALFMRLVRHSDLTMDQAFTALTFALTPLYFTPILAAALAIVPELVPLVGILPVILLARLLYRLFPNIPPLPAAAPRPRPRGGGVGAGQHPPPAPRPGVAHRVPRARVPARARARARGGPAGRRRGGDRRRLSAHAPVALDGSAPRHRRRDRPLRDADRRPHGAACVGQRPRHAGRLRRERRRTVAAGPRAHELEPLDRADRRARGPRRPLPRDRRREAPASPPPHAGPRAAGDRARLPVQR